MIAVVGGANVDISGFSARPLIARDSNPGRIVLTPGGVGRNIASAVAALGEKTALVTALGADANGDYLRANCQNIDLSRAFVFSDARTSSYLCINDDTGDMALAVNDMDICARLTPGALETRLDFLNAADLVILDANLPTESYAYLAQNVRAKLAADPVSVSKAARLAPVLHRLALFKPNLIEAEALTGLTEKERGLDAILDALLNLGVARVFLTLGARGAYCASPLERIALPCYNGVVRTTTGCGDAFLAAAAVGVLAGLPLEMCLRRALAASAIRASGEIPRPSRIDQVVKDGGIK